MRNWPLRRRGAWALLLVLLALAGCLPLGESDPAAGTPVAERRPATRTRAPAGPHPTLTLPREVKPQAGYYENPDVGLSFSYPEEWEFGEAPGGEVLASLQAPDGSALLYVFLRPIAADASLGAFVDDMLEELSAGYELKLLQGRSTTLEGAERAWQSEFMYFDDSGLSGYGLFGSAQRRGVTYNLAFFYDPSSWPTEELGDIVESVVLESPRLYGIPRDEALVVAGGESTNPRSYDPAHGGGGAAFSGLVRFNTMLQVEPDLAEAWELSDDGLVYTFHLRKSARFHDGRPVTAADVVYSWERAADPATDSDSVRTYLGDIVGVQEKRAGKAREIAGLKVLDAHTLQVTLDAPKPYFLMKLTYPTSHIVDRANVESGSEWYRVPNGTGAYRLARWDRFEVQIYERNEDYYLDPPAIRYLIYRLYAGDSLRMYERGEVDYTGVSYYSVERFRDPAEPMHAELLEGVAMCTSFIPFDVAQPPFDDPKVRQAFALAVDRERYREVVLQGIGLPGGGLYPPNLPGYNLGLRRQTYDPERARQLLAESRYGGAEKLPPITFTSSGFGSDEGAQIAALAQMWQLTLGVTITVENLEPNTYHERLYDGDHGQIFSFSWCADYPDPENFADVLFHSGAEQNLGHYSNPEVDRLLERARVERDVQARMVLYQQAEQLIVDDAPVIFMGHALQFELVKPYLKGFVLTPLNTWQDLRIEP